MEEITIMLRNIQTQINEQKQDMKNISKTIENIDEKFAQFNLKATIIEEKVEKQQKSVNYLEKIIRRKNLIFFGIEEDEHSYEQLEGKIRNIINNYMKINYSSDNLEYVGRLGRKKDTIRPVIVTFQTVGMKINILKNKKTLDKTNYYIKEDYPKEILNIRKQLKEKLIQERESGKNAILAYDKIIILDKNNGKEIKSINNYEKRNIFKLPKVIESQHQNTKNNKKTKK